MNDLQAQIIGVLMIIMICVQIGNTVSLYRIRGRLRMLTERKWRTVRADVAADE